MHDARLAGGYPSRRRNAQPTTITVRLVEDDGRVTEVEVDRLNGPGILTLPVLAPPAYLVGAPASDLMTMVGYQQLWFGKEPPDAFAKRNGASGIQNGAVTIDASFEQMIAKIAYACAVAVTGAVGREDSPIPDLLRSGAGLGTWVGSGAFELPAENEGANHALSHDQGVVTPFGRAAVVRLKLFAASGAPEGYEVVTHAEGWRTYTGIRPLSATAPF